jgi:hypothetical protein
MRKWQSQAQVNWGRKYRIVILPRSRHTAGQASMRPAVDQILRDLSRQNISVW